HGFEVERLAEVVDPVFGPRSRGVADPLGVPGPVREGRLGCGGCSEGQEEEGQDDGGEAGWQGRDGHGGAAKGKEKKPGCAGTPASRYAIPFVAGKHPRARRQRMGVDARGGAAGRAWPFVTAWSRPIQSTTFSVNSPVSTTATTSPTMPVTKRRSMYLSVLGRRRMRAVTPRKPRTSETRLCCSSGSMALRRSMSGAGMVQIP